VLLFVGLECLLRVIRVLVRRRRIEIVVVGMALGPLAFGVAYLLLSFDDKPVVTNHLADNLLGVALSLFPQSGHGIPPVFVPPLNSSTALFINIWRTDADCGFVVSPVTRHTADIVSG
jgi:hypothetical protein